jgi:hypothetical protein
VCNGYCRDAEIHAIWQSFNREGLFEHGPNSIPYLQKLKSMISGLAPGAAFVSWPRRF